MDGNAVPPPDAPASSAPLKQRSLPKRLALVGVGVLLVYFAAAYIVMPAVWKRYARRHPSLENVPGITHTADGIPGDPLNVALIGTEAEVKRLLAAAKWIAAKPLGLRSDLKIAEDTVLKRSDDDAPVSDLYLFGRKEDLAYEQPVDNNPRQRHHVRFWKSDQVNASGRPVWVGAAIYDQRVGFSRTTGQITHHVSGDIDVERDKLFADLKQTGELAEVFAVDGFHKVREGRNGGGDSWHTDGRLDVGVIGVQK